MPYKILTIPHPDDETMFFLPTSPSHILCLTSGNYSNLGPTRSLEFTSVLTRLRTSGELLSIPGIHDGPSLWSPSSLSSLRLILLEKYASLSQEHEEIQLITFDERGVSSHINHIQTSSIVSGIAKEEGYVCKKLVSIPFMFKWFPMYFIYIIYRYLLGSEIVIDLGGVRKGITIMKEEYKSQWIWWRGLWFVGGCYGWVNIYEGEGEKGRKVLAGMGIAAGATAMGWGWVVVGVVAWTYTGWLGLELFKRNA